MMYGISQFAYLVASACFIFALHWMNTPATARKGVYAGIAGTTIAILVTWAEPGVGHHLWIVLAIAAGVLVGVPLSRVPLTAVPQRTALSHAFGGLAAGLVGTAEYYLQVSEAPGRLTAFRMVALIDVTVVQGEPRTIPIQLPPGYELTSISGGSLERSDQLDPPAPLDWYTLPFIPDPAWRIYGGRPCPCRCYQ